MKVKLLLEPGETKEQAEDALVKALTAHENGDMHGDTFMDPVMESAADAMKEKYQEMNREMMAEIEEVIDREGL